jgi:hypothetical protein
VLGALGALTLLLSASSLYTLFASEGGGVFWGGLFTLLVGGALVVAVLAREVVSRIGLDGNRPSA